MAILAERVVPSILSDPTYREISLRWIDGFGDLRADVTKVDGKVNDTQVEAMVAAMVTASNASLHTVRITDVYAGVKSKDNAAFTRLPSVDQHIVYHVKNAAHISRRVFVPAPRALLFVGQTEIPNEADSRIVNLTAAWDTLFGGTYAGVSLRYTQRRDINKQVGL